MLLGLLLNKQKWPGKKPHKNTLFVVPANSWSPKRWPYLLVYFKMSSFNFFHAFLTSILKSYMFLDLFSLQVIANSKTVRDKKSGLRRQPDWLIMRVEDLNPSDRMSFQPIRQRLLSANQTVASQTDLPWLPKDVWRPH